MKAKIWTQEGCFLCDQAKEKLKLAGYEISERNVDTIEELKNGDVMAQYCMQNMTLPVIFINDKPVDNVDEFLKGVKNGCN